MNGYQINVGRRLRELREGYQYTQDDIETRTRRKIYRQFISRVEASADPKIQLSKIKAIAQAFEMDPVDFFSYLLGEARKSRVDLKSFLVSLGELSPGAIEDVANYYNFRKGQEQAKGKAR